MKLLKTFSAIAVISLNVLSALPVSAQASFDARAMFNMFTIFNIKVPTNIDRAKEVIQDNEFVKSSETSGKFLTNPIFLNGLPLDYRAFNLQSKGELTLVKGAAETGELMQIPFNVYLRRNGTMVKLHNEEAMKPKHFKIELSNILKFAQPGDQLIIEPVNKEDWQAKRILKLLGGGC